MCTSLESIPNPILFPSLLLANGLSIRILSLSPFPSLKFVLSGPWITSAPFWNLPSCPKHHLDLHLCTIAVTPQPVLLFPAPLTSSPPVTSLPHNPSMRRSAPHPLPGNPGASFLSTEVVYRPPRTSEQFPTSLLYPTCISLAPAARVVSSDVCQQHTTLLSKGSLSPSGHP